MNRRYLYTDRLFPVIRPSIKDGILVVSDEGRILEIVDPAADPALHTRLLEHPDMERFQGALVPGFINAHCHLELSHLKGRIPEGTGLPGFLRSVTALRNENEQVVLDAMERADRSMQKAGIVGVGDISNRLDSKAIKLKSAIRYHTFVEVFDLDPTLAEARFGSGLRLAEEFRSVGLSSSVTPHANYTVSGRLFSLLAEEALSKNNPITLHNQETASEDDFFVDGTGALGDFLKGTGKYDTWIPEGKSALRTVLPYLDGYRKTMLVHNTFTSEEDLEWALQSNTSITWCLCPKANRYIERQLPDAGRMIKAGARLAIGTDSLASNNRLSMLEEINELVNADPALSFEQLLPALTVTPALFLGWEKMLGDFSIGKSPGIVHLLPSDESRCGYAVAGMVAGSGTFLSV